MCLESHLAAHLLLKLAISYFAMRTTMRGCFSTSPNNLRLQTLCQNLDDPEEQISESPKRLAGPEVAGTRHRHRQRHRTRGYQGYLLIIDVTVTECY